MQAVDDDTATADLILQVQLEDIEVILRGTTDPAGIANLNDQAAALRVHHQETLDYHRRQLGRPAQQTANLATLADDGEEATTTSNGATESQINAHTDEEHPLRECYICKADMVYSQTTEVGDCGHIWCHTCLVHVFDLAAKNENNFPIRCCGRTAIITLDHIGIAKLMDAKVISAVQAKITEYETEDRTYCHDPKCSAFMAPDTITNQQATCLKCEKKTCMLCKAHVHEGECKLEKDEAFERWRTDSHAGTCNACHRVIIRSAGCNHMMYAGTFSNHAGQCSNLHLDVSVKPSFATNVARGGRPAHVSSAGLVRTSVILSSRSFLVKYLTWRILLRSRALKETIRDTHCSKENYSLGQGKTTVVAIGLTMLTS